MKKGTASQKVSTISDCIKQAAKEGYTKYFFITRLGLSYNGAPTAYAPDDILIRNCYRFEGYSDPAANSVLYLLQAPDGIRGILLDAYGMYSDGNIAQFIQGVHSINKRFSGKRNKNRKRAIIAAFIIAGLYLVFQNKVSHSTRLTADRDLN